MFLSYGIRLPYKYFLEAHLFDVMRSTDTHSWLPKKYEDTSLANRKYGNHYQASWTGEVKKSINFIYSLLGDEFKNYQFIDAGCGKGKPCFIYANYLIKKKIKYRYKILGIDYSKNMINIANNNKDILLSNKYINFNLIPEFICDDITSISYFVESKNLIIYMYNPFKSKVLISFLKELLNYNAIIIYNNPIELDYFIELGYKILYNSSGFHPSCKTTLLSNSL